MNAVLSTTYDNTTLSSKGQLVIPKALRERAHWVAGDQLQVVLIDEEIRLRRVQPASKSGTLDDVAGCLKLAARRSAGAKLSEAEIKKRIGERLRARLNA
jgi:AbrB family looped-hinge helix DNA binding protein